MRRFAFLVTGLLVGAVLMPVPVSAAAKSTSNLIPRQVLFGNPDRSGVQLSPDGSKISYRAETNGVLNVFVAPAGSPGAAKAVTKDTERGVRIYFWAQDSEHILYLQDKGGDENWRVFSVNISSGKEIDLTPFDGVAAQIQGVSHLHPEEILVGINNRDPRLHDVYRINISTGERTLVEENKGFVGFLSDDHYNLRFALAFTATGGLNVVKKGESGWEPFQEIGSADAFTTSPVGFDKSGETLYMVDSRDRNTSALVAFDLKTGESKVIASDDRADISGILTHPTEKTIQGHSVDYDRVRWSITDPAVKADFDYLATVDGGDINVTSRTLDDSNWIVVYVRDDGPVRYYRYDRKAKKATFLFTNRKELEGLQLAKMHPQVIPSRDGLNLVSYLSLPASADADGDGVPSEPLPMVLSVHGGPWARNSWGYNPTHQWLANRGYAVLSVNFRGSTGFGKEFINAADGEWGAKMHDDLIDAVDWAVAQKVADPEKVAIMGGSYGGYATLVGLTFTPEKFACGVDIVGPSNLVTLMRNVPPYWMPFMSVMSTRVGDVSTGEGRRYLRSISPLTHVEEIVKPLLIGQGANDPRVTQIESDQIVTAMKAREIPVTYVLFPDEGHGWARPENNLAFNAVTEAFLSEHIGGQYEPMGDDLEGSSITVPEGTQFVPGLDAALGDAPDVSAAERPSN